MSTELHSKDKMKITPARRPVTFFPKKPLQVAEKPIASSLNHYSVEYSREQEEIDYEKQNENQNEKQNEKINIVQETKEEEERQIEDDVNGYGFSTFRRTRQNQVKYNNVTEEDTK